MNKLSKRNRALIAAIEKGYHATEDRVVIGSSGKKLKLQTAPSGRKCFGVWYESAVVMICVHRLIAYQKFGDALFQEGMEVRHLDNNYLNNAPKNIALGTHQDNVCDEPSGFRSYESVDRKQIAREASPLNWSDVKEIRKLYSSGEYTQRQLAEQFGVSRKTISNVVNRKTWKS